ncbi:MAG: hypothetical protein H7Y61_03975, partial [Rhizobiales bacterium]|nr:hypothetical protein [Rhizobacter sp.]
AAPGAAQRGPFGNEAAAASSVLAAQRGGNGTSSAAQLKGAVSGNQATHVTTGANALGSGAFAGAGGVSTVIQNTGNNVLIQNSTIVNVQLK